MPKIESNCEAVNGDGGLILGDCVEAMSGMRAGSIDAVVTDPPYGLEFMGKEWDAFRLDDPGTKRNRGERAGSNGSIGNGDGSHPARSLRAEVSYGGGKRPTTSRCLTCGKRDQRRNPHACGDRAEWVTEVIHPHSAPPTMLAYQEWCRQWASAALRVLKPGGYMLSFGGTRTYHRLACAVEDAGFEIRDCIMWLYSQGFPKGKGCLKPAFEPILLARKPGPKVLPLGIDECRVGDNGGTTRSTTHSPYKDGQDATNAWRTGHDIIDLPAGRWPANVVHDGSEEVLEAFAAFGEKKVPGPYRQATEIEAGYSGGWSAVTGMITPHYGDTGTAARFFANLPYSENELRLFYTAKASRAEREKGLAGIDAHQRDLSRRADQKAMNSGEGNPYNRGCKPVLNSHPCVKPLALMEWLVKLVAREGDLVLDPFAGSGTTLLACERTGRIGVGIERDAAYHKIATERTRIVEASSLTAERIG